MMTRSELVAIRDQYFAVVYETADEGGFLVRFPALPGLVTEGESLIEARAMAADALRCFIDGRLEDGLPLLPSE